MRCECDDVDAVWVSWCVCCVGELVCMLCG